MTTRTDTPARITFDVIEHDGRNTVNVMANGRSIGLIVDHLTTWEVLPARKGCDRNFGGYGDAIEYLLAAMGVHGYTASQAEAHLRALGVRPDFAGLVAGMTPRQLVDALELGLGLMDEATAAGVPFADVEDVALSYIDGGPEGDADAPADDAPADDEPAPIRTIPVPEAPGGYHFDGVSSGEGPCVCCGRDVKTTKYGVVMAGGGGVLVHPDDEPRARDGAVGDYMGLQPVGSECRKLIPAEYLVRG